MRRLSRNPNILSHPTELVILWEHNHNIQNAESLRWKRISEDTKTQMLSDLAECGNVPEAKKRFEKRLASSICHLNDAEQLAMRADRSCCPLIRDWYYMSKAVRSESHGDQGGLEMRNALKKLAEEQSTSLIYEEWKEVVDGVVHEEFGLFIRTPLMSRVLEMVADAKDINFIDSTSSVDLICSTLTTIVTSSSVGVLPVGIAIHSAQTTNSYQRVFAMAKKFGIGAKVYITDDCDAEQAALLMEFENSIRLLCAFHVSCS